MLLCQVYVVVSCHVDDLAEVPMIPTATEVSKALPPKFCGFCFGKNFL